ncbi:unnamed protein product [Absidia cylindrospora]
MSAADMIRYHYHYHPHDPSSYPSSFTNAEDQYSSSSYASFDSTTSSVSDTTISTLAKSKKQPSYKRLLREIRRLRSENTSLHNSINILKEDLRHERESRQIAEQCHKKFFDDSIDTHTRLELEIMDQQDQLLAYQSRLNNTTNLSSINNSIFDDDDLLWGCEDMDCSIYDDDTNNDIDNDLDQDFQQLYSDNEDDQDNNHPFEELAVSYLRQALISNLTSARANLEFDDLMLKHDPSPARVLRTLADAFLGWICEMIHNSTATLSSSATPCTTTTEETNEKATCVARLMTTQVQDVFLHFWKNILERHVHNDEDQYQFLHQAECMLHHHKQQQQQYDESHYIVQNFHRLLVMLYKHDIVDGDAVVHWWHHLPESRLLVNDDDNGDVADQLRNVTRKFVEWVDEEEEEDDDDDNDEDLFANNNNSNNDDDNDDDDQYDSELDCIDELLDGPLEPTPADDSNVPRLPIHPVERKKKSVTIQV